MGYDFDRAYYRLVYPTAFRPTFRVGGEAYPVVDLSEQGVRLLFPEGARPDLDTNLSGVIVVRGAEAVAVEGRVVRVDPPFVSLLLSRGVPFAVMLEQQRFLHRRVIGRR